MPPLTAATQGYGEARSGEGIQTSEGQELEFGQLCDEHARYSDLDIMEIERMESEGPCSSRPVFNRGEQRRIEKQDLQ